MLVMGFYNLTLLLGIVILYFSSDWFIAWILVEISTLSIIIILSGCSSPRGVESTVKYFVVQALASVVLLMGILYSSETNGFSLIFSSYDMVSYSLILGAIFIKLAVFPNPFWFVDVVSGLDFARGAYVVILSKLIPVYLYYLVGGNLGFIVILVGLSSALYGGLLGINQTNIRKVIALSSVSHMGWVVLSFPVLSGLGCFFVFFSYGLMLVPLFWALSSLSLTSLIKAKNSYFSAGLLLVTLISLLSLAGFPPLLGFFYKWVMFNGLISNGFILVSGSLILLSLVSLFFYLQVSFSLISVYWPNLKVFPFWGLSHNKEWWIVIISSVSIILVGVGALFLGLLWAWNA
uniref:NADH-ubiquinone oxidoreductase chain 2 n=1 Tax=Ophiocomina nigra TaxID=55617 RepID=D3H5T6_9ECHI|nr:NADH dehydrogenase subunit 2 [Ophiocomina nigra]